MRLPIFARATTTEKINDALSKGIIKYPCYILNEETGFYGFVEQDKTITWFKGSNKDLVVIDEIFPDTGDSDVLYIVNKIPYVYDGGSFVSLLGEADAKIAVLQENVDTLNQLTDNLSDTLGAVQTNVSEHTTRITSLEAKDTEHDTALSNLQTSVDDLSSSVDSLGTRLTTAEGEIDTLQSDVSSLQSDVSDHATRISALEGNVTTLQSDVGALETTTTGLRTDLDALTTRVGDNEAAIEALNASQASQDAAIATKANSADVYMKAEVDEMVGDLGGVTVQEYVEQEKAKSEEDLKTYVDQQISITRV